jgi:basic amino acid/polyamine antiporter, APA family
MTTEVFVRKASGLVREMSPYSAFAYNVLAIGILFPFVYLQAPAVFPEANIAIGILICGIILIPMWYTYSWLSASMPRSGGDYVFQTRILTGWVGFSSTLMGAFMAMLYAAFAGWMFSVIGAAPMFAVWGYASNNMTLLGIANWLASPWGVIIVSLVILITSTATMVRGMGAFVKVQWVLFYGLLISVVVMLFVLLTTSQATFIQNFNNFYTWAAGITAPGGYHQQIIDQVKASGIVLDAPINWVQTIAVATLAANSLVWAVLAVQQLGEIKGANVVKNTNFFIVGSGVFSTLVMAVLAALFFKAGGTEFIRAVSVASWTGQMTGSPIQPWLGFMVSIASANPFVVFLICFGFMCNAYQVMHNVMIQAGRIVFAAAVDRLFPDWLSKVNPKYHSPLNMHIVLSIMIAIWIVMYNLTTVGTISLSAAAAFMIYFALTCVAGAVFPYFKKVRAIYKASPISNLNLGGIPLITITGVIGAIVSLGLLVLFLVWPDLGVYNVTSLIAIVGSLVLFIVYYFIRKAVMADKGIDVELSSKQLPPD